MERRERIKEKERNKEGKEDKNVEKEAKDT